MKPCMGMRASERKKKQLHTCLLHKALHPAVSDAWAVGCTFLSVELKFEGPNLGLVHTHCLAQFVGAISICVQGFFVIQACK
jgi:hypothetical protein